ncbi:MAG: hypothetical protein JZD40_02565, partial [Sulfolobus sp.]|nr:hypothetical protein [Sulfolobus sp.]
MTEQDRGLKYYMFLPAYEYKYFYTTNVSYSSDNNGNILIQIGGLTKRYTTHTFGDSYDIKLPVNYKRHEGYLIDLEYLKNKIINLNREKDKNQLSCYLVFRRSQRFGTVFMICYSQISIRNEYYALFGSLRNNRDENNLDEKLDLLMILDNKDILERLTEAKRQSKRIALITSGNTTYDTLNLNDAELYYFDYTELKKVHTISKIFLDINSSLDEKSSDKNGLYVAQGNVIEYYIGSLVYASDKFKYMLHELYKRLGDKIKVGGIDQTIREFLDDFEIIFISATLLDRELDEQISLSNLGGIPIRVLDTNKGPQKIEQFLKFLLGENLYNMLTSLSKSNSKYLYLPYQVDNVFQRLTFPVIVFTSPESKIRTYFTDMIVSSMIIADGLNNRPQGGLKVKTLAFIDNKTAQKEIYQEVLNRHIKEVMSPCDKLLLSDHKPNGHVGGGIEILNLMKQ